MILKASPSAQENIRTKKKTDWIRFKSLIRNKIGNFDINIENSTHLDQMAEKIQKLLTETYEKCCKEKVNKVKKAEWFSEKLYKMKKKT